MADAKPKMKIGPFEIPDTPLLFAGAVGGPFTMYFVTPPRNALTYAAVDRTLSTRECFGRVFSRGFLGGWTGGVSPAVAACPQFLILGPMFHAFNSQTGVIGAMALTGLTESLVVYGAETRNAQLAINAGGGKIPEGRVQKAFVPYGPGFGIHVARNILAISGMRLFYKPVTEGLEKVTGTKDNTAVMIAGDFIANIFASVITMPIHQLYGFTVSSGPSLWDRPMGERMKMMQEYLGRQYLTTTASGARTISSVVFRDIVLRSAYIATEYTLFANIERGCVRYWPW